MEFGQDIRIETDYHVIDSLLKDYKPLKEVEWDELDLPFKVSTKETTPLVTLDKNE